MNLLLRVIPYYQDISVIFKRDIIIGDGWKSFILDTGVCQLGIIIDALGEQLLQ